MEPTARDRSGAAFTLVEVTIVIVVVSIAGLFLAGVFREAVGAYRFVDVEADLLQQARYAEERTTRELRRVRDDVSLTTASATAVSFLDVDGVPVALSWNGTPGADLRYARNGASQTLATNVDSLAFGYWTANGGVAVPFVAPASTDVRRITLYLRLARGGQKVAVMGAAALRSL
jgi:type II secretory pathway pseudopilin PulG